ncbi:LysR family transcriptional regulator [Rhodobacterales bacterium HKCCE3408]|nr:LysR family transcriptional regulator [Rhodobacterales bacterium HKCCE3408]
MLSDFRDWSDVRVFLAVLRGGSTLAAAKALGLAQPTVARRIEALEHTLGLSLFDRDTRGSHPTGAAEALRPKAEALETAANAFAAAAGMARSTHLRPIRITAGGRNFSTRFAGILAEFSDAHPGTEFEFVATDQMLDLAAGEADVALRFALSIEDERLIATKLTEVRSALYASKAYVEKHGCPRSEAEFAGHRFIVYTTYRTSLTLNNWLTERIAPTQIASRCVEMEGLTAAVQAGIGIGPLPLSIGEETPGLVRCLGPVPGTSTFSWLVIGPEAWKRPEVKAFAGFFAPRFRALFRHLRDIA